MAQITKLKLSSLLYLRIGNVENPFSYALLNMYEIQPQHT